MKKSLIVLSCLAASGSALADKTLFSCTTEKDNLVTVIDKGSVFEYRVSNPKVPKADFSFETDAKEVNIQSKTEDGITGEVIEMTNNGYEYTIVSIYFDIFDKSVPAGIVAKDPQGNIVSEVFCKKFAEAIKKNKGKKPAKENKTVKAKTFGEGVYRVGKDIPAGEYQLKATGGFSASFAIRNNSSRSSDAIVAIDFFSNNTFITVEEGQYLDIRNCVAEKVE